MDTRKRPCLRALLVLLMIFGLMSVQLLAAPASAAAVNPTHADDWNWATLVMTFFGPIALLAILAAWRLGIGYPHCPECRGRVFVHEETRQPATQHAPGVGVRIRECRRCGWHDEKEFHIPELPEVSKALCDASRTTYQPWLPTDVGQRQPRRDADECSPDADAPSSAQSPNRPQMQ